MHKSSIIRHRYVTNAEIEEGKRSCRREIFEGQELLHQRGRSRELRSLMIRATRRGAIAVRVSEKKGHKLVDMGTQRTLRRSQTYPGYCSPRRSYRALRTSWMLRVRVAAASHITRVVNLTRCVGRQPISARPHFIRSVIPFVFIFLS